MLTPSFAALHAWRSDLRLCVLVTPAFASVLEGNPAVCEILLMRDFVSTARMLRARRFPVTYNQHGGPTSAFLTLAAGSPVRVCWARLQFSSFYNVRVPDPAKLFGRREIHTVEDRIAHFYFTGLPRGTIPRADVFAQPDAVASIRNRLAERGIVPGQPYAVLRPGAAHFTKQWPVERFVEVARWLRKDSSLAAVFDTGPGEQHVAAAVRQLAGNEVILLDSLDVRELIALIAGARLFVGNDTGPTHIAAAAGCPTVAIFAATDPAIWGPWQVPHLVVQADALCDTCPPGRCYASGPSRCILTVDTRRVQEACAALLAGTKPAGTS